MAKASPPKAEIAMGTLWIFSARFCAVTTISSIFPDASSVPAAVLVCAAMVSDEICAIADVVENIRTTKALRFQYFIISPHIGLLIFKIVRDPG
ncbi:hypothetical protein [Sphingobium chlorophenolicum]|uniref:hypothetical protein n=1 Tax=Sphingobium chlorophenolicum TaxID=46429 RepID=UPI0020D21201|nr:hypothetical protein [Sphingobium chlorophenolicum]